MEKLKLTFNNQELTATLADNSSAQALAEKLREGDLTIKLDDFANMEKVGSLGFSLPKNDERVNAVAGDLILYQGNNFVVYYDKNSWNFTRLGKIDIANPKDLKRTLGNGSLTVTLSLA
ncbi:cyclophilin-like fold protein [Tetragenococcus muriaticus]|uniref:cyclophilin-like fold protein n=1 Tax=Tetragenococcus muriaticus TaxID=64642 RepID=UPI00042A45BF|nr:cyclophilin-like fold protein [Tetragenococcus muriaticus]GMA47570.1 hypothetical protein GCM10025854_18200 [Tetragenococcus muriaticus]